jgi:hypothetical protein
MRVLGIKKMDISIDSIHTMDLILLFLKYTIITNERAIREQ